MIKKYIPNTLIMNKMLSNHQPSLSSSLGASTGSPQPQKGGSNLMINGGQPIMRATNQKQHQSANNHQMIVLHQPNGSQVNATGYGPGNFKIKKEDMKLLQQYVENDLGNILDFKNVKKQSNTLTAYPNASGGPHHQKTNSEGATNATPLGQAFVKTQYGKQKMQPIPLNMINQAPGVNPSLNYNTYNIQQQNVGNTVPGGQQQQSPFLDYQKFLEDEKLVFQNQKAKSHVGYYSVGPTPQNVLGNGSLPRSGVQQSKSPDLNSFQIKAAHFKNQKHNKNILGSGSALGAMGPATNALTAQQPNIISQSALASYSNVQNLLQQHSNRERQSQAQQQNTQSQGSGGNNSQSVGRPSSRKKQTAAAAAQNLIYDQGVYPQQIYLQKNGSHGLAYANPKAQSVLLHNKNDHSTLEALSKDQLNESSNFLSDDPLMKSNQQLQNHNVHSGGKGAKQQFQQYNASMQDESYLDASVYEQFISGPHNISHFTGGLQLGGAANHKILDEINSYSQYIQRPLSQNTNPNKTATSKLGRQSPAQKNNTTRSVNQQMHSSQPKKAQRTASLIHNSLNSSGQKQQMAQDRRLLVGRTPSPNFLKRIAGLMNIGNDFILPQQVNFYKNINNSNLIVGAQAQSKRSQSKQAFSSNPQAQIQQLQPQPHQPIQQNFIHIAPTNVQALDKSLKQKFMKQQTTALQQQQQPNILSQGSRFKSGSLTTSANTAQNSPRSQQAAQNASAPLQRNQKTSQTTIKGSSLSNAYSTDFHTLADALKKGGINQQQKLKMINEMEEKKALALVKGIKDYQHSASLGKQQQQQQAQLLQQQQYQQQYHQPKMISEILEEDANQPLSSNEFMEGEDNSKHQYQSQEIHQQNYIQKKSKGKAPGHKGNSKSISHTPNPNMMIDGGTGSNGIIGDIFSQQQRVLAAQAALSGQVGDNSSSISAYLEQLQNLRQGQKSQLSHHQHPPIVPLAPSSSAMSPVTNKTASHFFKQQQLLKQGPLTLVNPAQIQQAMLQQNQLNIKPILQQYPGAPSQQKKFLKDDVSPNNFSQSKGVILNIDSNRDKGESKKRLIDPPKITTPSVDMYKGNSNPMENSQPGGKKPIIFNEKTPFERELDQKASEIKNSKKATQEQQKLQKYKEDSISILKQLQESGSIVLQQDLVKEGSGPIQIQQKKGSVDNKRLVVDMVDGQKKKGVINIGGPAAAQLMDPRSLINSPKHSANPKKPMNTIDDRQDDNDGEILMTQEEEQQIKEVISDLNHKAFYGKVMKKTKENDLKFMAEDENLRNLSPRSREIANVIRMIKSSFEQSSQPPVTTTDFYRIGKMLGRGAFGKVNLAMHKLVRKLVAIKSLNKECLTDEAQKQKLMKEVSLLLKLRHNHVVKIYETIETDKHIIIVMELCAGGDLLNYVRKRRRLKEPYAKVIFKQIIDGLCYIHSKFIAHRDIKLDNILLDGKGNVKIADFGVSKQCQKGQLRMTEQCGTPAYIAPEILKDKGYTFSVDLWSAGVVLFAMLYGTVPFKANNMEELHKLIVKGKYLLKDDISIEARNLLRGLLEVNPEKRLTIKQIYRHKWFADLDPNLQLFNDQERDMIRKEYTYNDPRRYNRNENEEPVDCFTEHNLESVYNSLKNVTSKSIILAPFNSTQSQIMEEGQLRQSVSTLIMEKMMILKFARRCREIDRQYEFNNNGELDNGVYHKFINNTEEQDDSGDENANQEDVDKELLCIPMLMSTRKIGGGKSSIENSFEEEPSIRRLQEKQQMALKIKEGSALQKEIHRNRKNIENEIDQELVKTYEEFQTQYSNKLDQEKIRKLVQHGYPMDYVRKSLEEFEPNYCTAGYYLLGMDQNYC